VNVNTLEILGEIPGVNQVHSPTGNRTASDSWVEVRVAFRATRVGPAMRRHPIDNAITINKLEIMRRLGHHFSAHSAEKKLA